MAWVHAERRSLASTFATTDPEQPTLCEGWTVRHLLAHVVQRERQPLDAWRTSSPRRGPGREAAGRLVSAPGPPRGTTCCWPASRKARDGGTHGSAESAVSFLEYVFHDEDVRRGGTIPLAPRRLPDEEEQAIWHRLQALSRLAYRRSPVGVTLALPTGPRRLVHRGEDGVVLTGDPVELLLHTSGRRSAAHVELTGPHESVRRFQAWADAHHLP